jgi:hypothetical protein
VISGVSKNSPGKKRKRPFALQSASRRERYESWAESRPCPGQTTDLLWKWRGKSKVKPLSPTGFTSLEDLKKSKK